MPPPKKKNIDKFGAEEKTKCHIVYPSLQKMGMFINSDQNRHWVECKVAYWESHKKHAPPPQKKKNIDKFGAEEKTKCHIVYPSLQKMGMFIQK